LDLVTFILKQLKISWNIIRELKERKGFDKRTADCKAFSKNCFGKFAFSKFKVCKSVRHRTIQINHQPEATISPVYYPDVYLHLNMFLDVLTPIIRISTTAVAASGFTFGAW
jgi:hypothetical protein